MLEMCSSASSTVRNETAGKAQALAGYTVVCGGMRASSRGAGLLVTTAASLDYREVFSLLAPITADAVCFAPDLGEPKIACFTISASGLKMRATRIAATMVAKNSMFIASYLINADQDPALSKTTAASLMRVMTMRPLL